MYLCSPSVVQGRKISEQCLEDFIEGLGPAQMVGRQVLGEFPVAIIFPLFPFCLFCSFFYLFYYSFAASPCMGDIQLSFYNRKGVFEVEVIRARGLLPKPGSKILPGMLTIYVPIFGCIILCPPNVI